MKRWVSVTAMALLISGCSQKINKGIPKQAACRPENLMFLNDLHAQFPSNFSLQILQHFIRQGKLTEASDYVNKSLENSPNCAALHIAQGFIWEAKALLGEPNASKMASVAYQAAITADPSKPAAYYLLGQQTLSQGDTSMATKYLAQAVVMRPNEPKLLYALACAAYRNQDLKTAYCSIKKVLTLDPTNPLYQRTATIIFAATGHKKETQQAFAQYTKAVGLNHPDTQYVSNRIASWQNIHSKHQIIFTANEDDDDDDDTPDDKKDSKDDAAKEESPSFIIDGYVLLITKGDNTQKGNNLLNGYDQYNRVVNPLSLVLGGSSANSGSSKPLFWWGSKIMREGLGGNAGTARASGQTFNYNITPVALNYALNIANASYNVATYSSRPTISTLLGKRAAFFGGVVIQTAPSGGSLITIDAGDVLEVTPKEIADDGLITLDITMTSAEPVGQNGSNVLTQNALSQGLGNQLVQVNSSKLDTIIKAYPGQTIMVGGLKTITRKVTDSRVPFFGNIPILQYFFSSVQNQMTDATILYLLTVRLGGQSTKKYSQKGQNQDVFKQLHDVDPKGFSFCATPTLGLILKHLSKTSLIANFQSGDVTIAPESQTQSLPDRLEQLKSFLHF